MIGNYWESVQRWLRRSGRRVWAIMTVLTPYLVLAPLLFWVLGASFLSTFVFMGTYLLIALQRIAGELMLLRKRPQIDRFEINSDGATTLNLGSSGLTVGSFTAKAAKLTGD